MGDFAEYLGRVAEDLKVLQGDIAKIIATKTKEAKETGKKDTNKKETAKEQFQKVSLKSMQPVTKMYKSKEEIINANENPEMDFVVKKLEDIFSK